MKGSTSGTHSSTRRRYQEAAQPSFELKILFFNPGVEITLSSSGNKNLTSKDALQLLKITLQTTGRFGASKARRSSSTTKERGVSIKCKECILRATSPCEEKPLEKSALYI